MDQSNFSLAASDFDGAIKFDPSHVDNYVGRGVARSRSGDNKGALSDFDEAIRRSPKTAELFAMRASTKFGFGDFKGAHADMKQALALDPGLLNNPQWDRAAYEEILKQDGKAPADGLTDRCINPTKNFSANDQISACQLISRDENIDSSIRNGAFNVLGMIYFSRSDYDLALNEYTLGLKVMPDPDTYVGRSVVLVAGEKFQAALEDLDNAIRLEQRGVIYASRAMVKARMGDRASAKVDAEKALKLDPSLSKTPYTGDILKTLVEQN